MIDVNFVVNHAKEFQQAMQKRNKKISIKKILELYEKRKKIMLEFENLAAK